MLKLFFGEKDGHVQGSTIPVRWCADKETLDKLKEKGIKRPHILLVVISKTGNVLLRQLAPLERLLDYIQFQRPGVNIICATIVWDDGDDVKRLHDKLITRSSNRYISNSSIINIARMSFARELKCRLDFVRESVDVPKELFAKEPARWLKTWVNAFYENHRLCDECHFRSRLLFAFTVQPLLVLLILIFRALAAVSLVLIGARDVDFKPIIHPLKADSDDVWWHVTPWDRDSFYVLRDLKLGKLKTKTYFLLPLIPMLVMLILAVAILGSYYTNPEMTPMGRVGLVSSAIFVAEVVLILAFAILQVLFTFIGYILPLLSQGLKKMEYVEPTKYDYLVDQLLICNGDHSTDFKSLPSEKRTIILRYKNFKAKVCKPFANW
jgi:hypothetical protein